MLPDRLRTLRLRAGKSQADIAGLLNITREAYSMYENGKRQPSFDALLVLADFYMVSMDYLFGRTDTPAPAKETTDEERMLLSSFQTTDDRGRQLFLALAKFEYNRQVSEKKVKAHHPGASSAARNPHGPSGT